MRINTLHPWNLTPTEAVALQKELADRVVTRGKLDRWQLIAGADVSYNRFSSTIYAGVVVLRMPDLTLVERQGIVTEARFPYRTGLLTFRETPALLEVFAKLQTEPEVIMLDGQGYAHPRRMGYASHVGLCLDRPSIGCAKSRLVGSFNALKPKAGSLARLIDRDEVVGMAVRTKNAVNPVYVSVGHKIDLNSAVAVVLATCRGYRVPEPTRQAHLYVNQLRRGEA